jgi:hypothetical protein
MIHKHQTKIKMKEIILITYFSIFSFSLIAQKYSIGIESGMSISNRTFFDFSNQELGRNGIYLGSNFNYHVLPKITLSSGVHYLQEGHKFGICWTFADENGKVTARRNNLMIPLIFNYHLGKQNRLTTFFGIYGTQKFFTRHTYPEIIGGCEKGLGSLSYLTRNTYLGGIAGVSFRVFDFENIHVFTNAKVLYSLTSYHKFKTERSSLISANLSVNCDL